MTLSDAKFILGPIRCYVDHGGTRRHYTPMGLCLDCKPATNEQIFEEAKLTWEVMPHASKQMIIAER